MTTALPRSNVTNTRTGYLGVMLTASAMAAMIALLVIVLLAGRELTATLTDLTQGPDHALAHLQTLALLIVGPAACAVAVGVGMWRLIWATRVLRYTSALRAYCQERLHRDAPLYSMGIQPLVVALASLSAETTPRPIDDALADSPSTLLLGASGSGKTTALLVVAHGLSARSSAFGAFFGFGGAPLPVLVSSPGLARTLDASSPSIMPYLANLVARIGTEGLGARSDRLLRAGRLMLLCDDYDRLDDAQRDLVNRALGSLRVAPYARSRIVVACDSQTYAGVVDDLGPLAQFQTVELVATPVADLTRAFKKIVGKRQRAQERQGLAVGPTIGDLRDHPLYESLSTAAVAAALSETLAAGERVAWGRASLLRSYLRLASDTASERDLPTPESDGAVDERLKPGWVWGALAASLQQVSSGVLPLDPTLTVGECAHAWLTTFPPPAPTDFALNTIPEFPLDRLERDIQAGLTVGMLRRSLDGLTLGFCHRLAQVSAAAWWLDLTDDGLGRLNSRLLRPQWAAPVALWAGAHDNPHDLAQRIFRFANSPSSVAPRAGLMDSQDVYPLALALSLVAILEGVTPRIAHMISRQETASQAFAVTQQGLRDLLDAAVIYGNEPVRRQRLTHALARMQQEVGHEFVANLGRLARESHLDRLLRAQICVSLGLTATPEAIHELMPLMLQSDPTMRQAVAQALVYADAQAIPALQIEARAANPQSRRRAEETLRLLTGSAPTAGEAAGGSAIAGLNSPDPAQRRVAVTTLSAIGASEALNELIARLDDVNLDVRRATAAALGALGGKRALIALRKRADSDDPELRLAVAQALGVDPETASTEPLLRLLKDRDARVRAAAATSLGAIADKRAVGPLREASEDSDPWVRHAAQTAVRRYTRT